MPAEAGIQAVGEAKNFKDLDSRFRGNDGLFPVVTQSPTGEGRVGVIELGLSGVSIASPLTPTLSRKGRGGIRMENSSRE